MMVDPHLSIVAAVSRNHVIGKDNQLLWNLPADMAHFKQLTSGHAVIMGSKTYLSLPERFRPLPNRLNIILSRTIHDNIEGQSPVWVTQLKDATDTASHYAAINQQQEFFVIGGGDLYTLALPLAKTLYLTHVDAEYEGDTLFPDHYTNIAWEKTILSAHAATETQPAFTIMRYDRQLA